LFFCLGLAGADLCGCFSATEQAGAESDGAGGDAAGPPDERYKVDILLVVAQSRTTKARRRLTWRGRFVKASAWRWFMATPLGAAAANEVGRGQAAALGAIREIEGAARACNSWGLLEVWFLRWQRHRFGEMFCTSLSKLESWSDAASNWCG